MVKSVILVSCNQQSSNKSEDLKKDDIYIYVYIYIQCELY